MHITQTVSLTPQPLTKEELDFLEKRNLIYTLRPSASIAADIHADAVDTMYATDPMYGSHKLICVRKNATDIRLTTHPENEDVIFLAPVEEIVKPLFLIIALDAVDVFIKKVQGGTMTAADLRAYRIRYNDPYTAVFTIRKNVPHCEVTIPGDQAAPIFYVTEPTDMTMAYVPVGTISFVLSVDG